MKRTHGLFLLRQTLWLVLALPMTTTLEASTNHLDKINHIIVLFQENWSFDSLYPDFPGADGLANAGPTLAQTDKNGQPVTSVSQPLNAGARWSL